MKALEPYPKKLGIDTWHYAKRAFLALADTLAAGLGQTARALARAATTSH